MSSDQSDNKGSARAGAKSGDNAEESQPEAQASEQASAASATKPADNESRAAGRSPRRSTGGSETNKEEADRDEPVFVSIIEKLRPDEKERLWSKILGQLSARGRSPQIKSQGIYTDMIDTAFPDDADLRAKFRELLQKVPAESHARFLATVSGIQGQGNRTAAVRLAGVVDAFEQVF